MRYLMRRAIHGVGVLAGVSVLSFLLLSLAPGNYLSEMRLNPQISPATIAAMRARYGLDQPLPVMYLRWVASVARGDMGYSFAYNTPAGPLLFRRAVNTLLLTVTAGVIAWLLSVPLGLWLAAHAGRWPDRLGTAAAGALLAVPDLLLALALLMLAVRTGVLPAGGMHSPDAAGMHLFGRLRDLAAHLVLPATVLVLGALPVLVRHVRAAVLEVLGTPYIRAARAHGIPPGRLLFHHALRAAANPLIGLLGFWVGTLVSASLLVEVIVSWPGLGPLLLEAMLARDLFVVIDGVLLSAAFLVGGNLLADVLLYVADPRIRNH
jgi:peptide/nickel transport system permease protein